MKRLLVTLDDDTHEDLRRLTIELRVPVVGLIRLALNRTFEDDLDRIAGERGLEDDLRDPSGTVTIGKYARRRGIALPGEANDDL